MKHLLIFLTFALIISNQMFSQEKFDNRNSLKKNFIEKLYEIHNLNSNDLNNSAKKEFIKEGLKISGITELLENLENKLNNTEENNYNKSRTVSTETFLENGFLLVESINQTWNGSTWNDTSRTTYIYNVNNNVVQETFQYWNGSSWGNNNRRSYIYDMNENITERIYQNWDGILNTWVNSSRYTYAYDGNNNQTERIYQTWIGSDWENNSRYNYTYDINNNLIEQISQYWSLSTWINNSRYSYTYDEFDNEIERLYQNWNGIDWENSSKYTNTYDIYNNRIEYIYEIWDGMWLNNSRSLYYYDIYNNMIEQINQSWDVSVWKNNSRYVYLYSATNNVIELLMQTWDTSNWVNSLKLSVTYDSNDNMIEYLIQIWDVSVWKNDARYTFTYDADGNNTEATIQTWDGASWVNEIRELYYYSPSTSIELITPNGGENWTVGTPANITWTSNNIASIKIQYTTNNGVSWINIANVTASAGSYNWFIPNTPSTDCKVLISDVSNAFLKDESDSVFTISPFSLPALQIISPNGGENWEVGSTHQITWSSNDVDSIKIDYSTNGGTNWINIIPSVAAETGNYNWDIPNTPSNDCKVLLSDVSNALLNSQSTDAFTIQTPVSPVITVTSPNGGEDWETGSTQEITWISNDVTNVKIDYSTNNGTNWVNIISSLAAEPGNYSWTIPNTPSANCKILISDVSNALINDQSNDVFTISVSASPVITVTSPNGNENWAVGSSHSIAWISSNITNVKIDYSTNNGTNWINIVSSTPAAAGNYSWTIPNTPSTNCKVLISDVSNALISDQSNNVFTLFDNPSTFNLNTTFSFGDPTKTSSYKIIGLPGANNIPVANIMTGSPGKENDWRVFWDNGELPLIEYNGSNTFTFAPGKAFFVISKNQISIDLDVNAVTLTTDNSYSIALHNEWNLISNPFYKTIAWSSVQSINSVTQPIHYYSNGSYSTQSNFEPFKGYYFFNSGGLTNLKIPYITSSGLGKNYNTATNELEIFLSLNNIAKAQISAGFSDEASPGIDMLDIFSPPSVFCDVSMSIYSKEVETSYKYLQKEYRPEIGEGQEFNILVKNTTDKKLEMVIHGLQNFIDYEIYLLDKQLMRLYDLKITNIIEIKKHADMKEYALFIGTKEFMKQKRADLLPSEFTLYQNYPNPFNPATKIMFALPEQSNISLKIYNVLGELVADLINDQIYNAGYYEVNFDGTQLASGIYIYRLQADGNSISRKMILIR